MDFGVRIRAFSTFASQQIVISDGGEGGTALRPAMFRLVGGLRGGRSSRVGLLRARLWD